MKILFFGRYDPEYARNHVILKGLRGQGVEIIECGISPADHFWFLRLLWCYIRMRPKYDVLFVPFPGQEVMLLAPLVTRGPIMFDAFSSHYGGYVLDRKKVSPGSLRARWYRFLDWWSCRCADAVLLDTQAHIDFFMREFGLPRALFHRVWVGADPERLVAQHPRKGLLFTVLFWGHYIPLHGIDVIVDAAKILRDEPIEIILLGSGQLRPAIEEQIRSLSLNNIRMIGRMPYDQLKDYIAGADVCLGVFSSGLKTQLVIPNKVYEALAAGKPLITADTSAIRELFTDHDMMLVSPGDGAALARAITYMRDHPGEAQNLAQHGHATYLAHATPTHIGVSVVAILHTLT